MKKLLLITLAGLWSWCTHAQGTFTFSNHVIAARLDEPVFNVNGTSKVEGPNLVAAVFLNGVQLGAPAPFRTGAGAGYWDAGADSLRVVSGKFSGAVVTGFTVEVWDSTKGSTVQDSQNKGGKFGFSKAFSITLGGPKSNPLLPPDVPAAMSNFTSFALGTPEPSVLALGVLGAVAMLIRRRHQQPVAASRPSESNL